MTHLMLMLCAVLGTVAPPNAKSLSWMQPAAFRLTVGMPEAEARKRLATDGRVLLPGRSPDEVVVEYQPGKTVTLQFSGRKLVSMRFELVDFLPSMKDYWREVKSNLQVRLGVPQVAPKGTDVMIWTDRNPQVMAALSMKKDDQFGRQGLGFIVIRHFAPPAAVTRGAAGSDRR